MLVVRFQKVGRRNQRSFRLIVTPKRAAPRGKPVEFLGSWNVRTKQLILKRDRILYWISQGAKPSPTAHNLLIKQGVLAGKKIAVHKKSKKPTEAGAVEAALSETAAPSAEPSSAQEPNSS